MIRRSLFTAAAAAPLLLFAGAPASAQTTINDARTTQVRTSTVNNGNPDNVSISTAGSVTVTSGEAVVVDSNNTLTNNGRIGTENANNTTGILIQGGHTGSVSNVGSIILNETYAPTDQNNDGVLDGAYAEGTGRYGIRLVGPGTFVGSITNGAAGSIQIEGNNSFGISLESGLQGDLISDGGISILGDNSAGVRASGDISGKVRLGTIGVQGGGSVGYDQTGNVAGSVSVYNSVQSTGYRTGTRSADPAANAGLRPDNLLQSGSAMNIAGDVLGGVFIGAPPSGTSSTDTTTDADGDGIVDSAEGTGVVTTIGSAPAISVGAAGRNVRLGAFGTGDNAYGLIVRGRVQGDGVFDDRSGAAIRLGTGDGTVNLDGGVRVVGTVSAKAREADATGIQVRNGASAPQLRNEGAITAEVISAKASNAIAVLIDQGGSVTSIANGGSIAANLTGGIGNAAAIVDRAGTVSSVVNSNLIGAVLTPASSTQTPVGQTIALDLRANTSGVSLTQTANSSTTITPTISGDILLGSGDDTVQFLAGRVNGALAFGAGSGSLLINGGANFQGALTASGALSSINVNDGTLGNRSASTIQVGSLTVGDKGVLVFSADPVNNRATQLQVTGPATIVNGGRLGLNLVSLPGDIPQTYTVITSPNLNVGSSVDLTAQAPFLFIAGFDVDQGAGTVDLTVRRRTVAEADLNRAQGAAYNQVYAGLAQDAGIQRAFLSQFDHDGFTGMLNQMLPDHAGGVFRALSWAAERHGVATGESPLGQEQSGPTRAWTNEIVLHEEKDPGDASGYQITAFSLLGGLESVASNGAAIGGRFAFTAANVRNPDLAGDNILGVSQVSLAGYWRRNFGPLRADAQIGAGFAWIDGRREFLFVDTAGVVHRRAEAKWTGYSVFGRFGLAYTAETGRAFFEPRVHVDYFRLHEGGYTEEGGGAGFDYDIDSRSSDALALTGSIVAGMTFGSGFRWRPQIEVGYRTVLAGSVGATDAQLANGAAPPFSLLAEDVQTSALMGRIGVRVYSNYLDLLLSAGAEVADEYTDIDVNLTARTVF